MSKAQNKNLIKLINEIKDYAILTMDTNGIIQDWNAGAERIKGYVAEEIIGKNFKIFYTKSDQQNGKPNGLIEKAKSEGVAHDEGWRVRKDNTTFWGSITISAIHDAKGNVVGFGKITRDLTYIKEAEEKRMKQLRELEQKNSELEQFAYIASHDLQEPLRTLISFSALIQQGLPDNPTKNTEQYIDFISKSAKRMQELVKGLLDFSRIGKERALSLVDCNKIVTDVLSDAFVLIKESNAEIIVNKLPSLNGYSTELRQLFQNLIINALKFRKKDVSPKIKISVKNEKNNWLFSVKDNGIGIEEVNKNKIFIIFKRLHNRHEYEGTGIGLSFCKKIVELHDGEIYVSSKINEGCVFNFTISKHLKLHEKEAELRTIN